MKGLFALVAFTLLPAAAFGDETTPQSRIERGKYLAAVGNCVSCHAGKGSAALAGGVAFHTDFGTIYSTNITPDVDTGIGAWTRIQFRDAMRLGVSADGRHLYPAFPFTAFTKLDDTDVDAIYDYLMSLPPVRAPASANELAFPFDQRWLMGLWKKLYFREGRFEPNPRESREWNRGKYLVEGLGHCSACHTPRNILGAENRDELLAGGAYFDRVRTGQIRRWSAVNLTSAESGLKRWSVDDIAAYLRTGVNVHAGTFGPMNEVIMNSTRHLTEPDARAMALYLKSLAPIETSPKMQPSPKEMQTGSEIYSIHCGTCHLPTGMGSIDTGPALAGNPVTQAEDPATLINVILYGPELPDHVTPTKWMHMEAYGSKLSDREVAALSSFLRASWGNRGGAVSAGQVAEQR